MRITVRQLKGLIREAVREVIVKQINENDGGSTQNDKAELISKWKGSGESNGMPDHEWAELMYLTGAAIKSGDKSDESAELYARFRLKVKDMKIKFPGFTAKDFMDVALAVDENAADPHRIRDF